ncbi:cell division protein FtsL [Anaerobranca gottschalkii]|uniref:Cell division protein FtsL n=1 Tax=Anaerobranca gottschalkii DSM 13577 TaxID=1120990 RepID=A0A1H9YV69_9FIRM|nr:cell division protein FtsL [Anaerobranca gottschalkii]SES73012.1 cell division protein FtsL [Anaerobranca gottschalkii DSM 13577]
MVAVKKERVNYQYLKPNFEGEKGRQAKKLTLSPVVKTGLLILALVAMGITIIYRSSVINSYNLELQSKKRFYNNLMDEKYHLQLEVARLSSIARIDKIATEQLDLRPPKPEQIVIINTSNWSDNGN